MSARVVDELELIEVQVHHNVLPSSRGDLLQGLLEPVFELGTVDQVRELIVAGVVCELLRVFLAELELLELALGAVDAAYHALRQKDSDGNQGASHSDDHEQEHGPDPAGCLAQSVRESVLPGLELFVDLDDAVQNESQLGAVHLSCEVDGVKLRGRGIESREELVSCPPDVEHALHVAHSMKPLIQADHTGDVVRMGAAFEEAGAHDGILGLGLLELEARLAETEWNADRLLIIEEVGFGPRLGEAQQVEHRLLLILGPEALAFHVRPAGRQDVYADYGKPDQDRNDDQ